MLTSNNKTRLMQGFSITILGVGLLASFPAAAEKYYKWVDDAGSTHYTQTPPPKAYIKKSALVDIIATPPSSTPVPPVVSDLNQNSNNNAQGNPVATPPAANTAEIGITSPPVAVAPSAPSAR